MRWETNGILNFASGEVIGRSLSSLLQEKIVALDASTGTTLWERQALYGTPSRSAIVLSDVDPYTGEGTATAVDTRSGTLLWERTRQPLHYGGTTKGITAIASRGCPVSDAA
jgi:outer membrane protein assembly factor BamB